ncbi:MAG: hypothetical protein WC384_21660 [Prolixibacteraceae bacterium]|jgi:hypothetical protein
MKIIYLIACFSVVCLLFTSCSDESPEVLTKEKITGFIQKGPFLNGTSVSISELKTDLSQTGKSFDSQIKDNQGTFELANVQLSSPYVEIKADGFYFNEVTGLVSTSRLILYALADVTDINNLNVNIISTLEKARVENLIAGGLSFADAKKKAMEEILAIFSLSKSDIQSSELLDINKSGDGNAILLAISSILQGYRTEAELSELLANLSADISTDGKLDSEVLGTALLSHARFLNTANVRENLEKRYDEIGATTQIPEFETYIAQFVTNSTFKAEGLFIYPKTVDAGLNLLNEENLVFPSGYGGPPPSVTPYSYLSATTLKGLSLKIKLEYIEGGDSISGYWGYNPSSNINWKVSDYNLANNSQTFEVVESGKACNLRMSFPVGNGVKIRISYFENNDMVATRTRIITVN